MPEWASLGLLGAQLSRRIEARLVIRRKREVEEAAIAAAKQAAAEKWEAVQQRFGLVRRSPTAGPNIRSCINARTHARTVLLCELPCFVRVQTRALLTCCVIEESALDAALAWGSGISPCVFFLISLVRRHTDGVGAISGCDIHRESFGALDGSRGCLHGVEGQPPAAAAAAAARANAPACAASAARAARAA